jgi:hypothetical protein
MFVAYLCAISFFCKPRYGFAGNVVGLTIARKSAPVGSIDGD